VTHNITIRCKRNFVHKVGVGCNKWIIGLVWHTKEGRYRLGLVGVGSGCSSGSNRCTFQGVVRCGRLRIRHVGRAHKSRVGVKSREGKY